MRPLCINIRCCHCCCCTVNFMPRMGHNGDMYSIVLSLSLSAFCSLFSAHSPFSFAYRGNIIYAIFLPLCTAPRCIIDTTDPIDFVCFRLPPPLNVLPAPTPRSDAIQCIIMAFILAAADLSSAGSMGCIQFKLQQVTRFRRYHVGSLIKPFY